MRSRKHLLLALAAAIAQGADFDEVKSLLDANCSQCHSEKVKTSGFFISTPESIIAGGNRNGRAVIAGKPEDSPLIKALRGSITPRMPLGKSLQDSEIALIENWIRNLTPAADTVDNQWRWPYRKPVQPGIPAPAKASWVRNPIDAFILKKLEEKRLTPAPEASRRALARRAWFDLIGMPPSPEEMDLFLKDASPAAYARLVDRLLDDPRYGERWGRHWLDLVRYGETDGLEGDIELGREGLLGRISNGGGNAWRYRDWVINAFNTDMPYNEFARRQIGGADEHSKTRNNYFPDVQSYVPLGYYRVAPWDVGNLVADEVRQSYLDEITGATSSIFLGLTLGCARCHDHKYDPIPAKDYYRFQAFFNAIQIRDVEVPYQDKEFREIAEAKIKELEQRLKQGPEQRELKEYETQLLAKLKAEKIAEAKTKELSAADLRLELRKPERKIFSEAEARRQARLLADFNRTRDPDEKQALDDFENNLLVKLKEAYSNGAADPLARFDHLTRADLRAEFGGPYEQSRHFTRAEVERHQELSTRIQILQRRVSRWKPVALSIDNVPGPPVGPGLPPTRVLIRGDFRQPGEAVEPGFPTAITGKQNPATIETDRYRQFPTRGRRITLARWIASADNPLTARVMVNRIWQQHFGRGIVQTASDFGRNGSRPTHPELLDWLALKFIENGWSIKSMHRLMMTSSAYRQAADNPFADKNTVDPDNVLLWRFNRRRLEGEVIRDSVLFLSGRLNPERGGPPMFPPLPAEMADLGKAVPAGGAQWETNDKEEDARRRSIYIFQRRSLPVPMLASFDAPVFHESCERRSATTTSLQALSMMNGNLVNEEADHLAARVATEAGADRTAQIRLVFNLVLSRAPSPIEMERFAAFGGPLSAICRTLLNSNELLYVD